MKCPYCKATILDGSKFCGNCGRTLLNDDFSDDPAHEIRYTGSFAQHVSGENKVTNINMQGGVGAVQQLDPRKAYISMVVMLSFGIVFAIIGLIFGLQIQNATNKQEAFPFVMAFGGAFAGFLFGLIGYLASQFRLFKIQKPSGFKDWIPTILFIIDIGVSIPALIYAIKAFQYMLA